MEILPKIQYKRYDRKTVKKKGRTKKNGISKEQQKSYRYTKLLYNKERKLYTTNIIHIYK